MPFLTEQKQKFDDLRVALHEDHRTQLKRTANGGNTVLFVYPPAEEEEYIAKAKELYPDGYFIDVTELYVKSIDLLGDEYNSINGADKERNALDGFKAFYRENISTSFKAFTNDYPNCRHSNGALCPRTCCANWPREHPTMPILVVIQRFPESSAASP